MIALATLLAAGCDTSYSSSVQPNPDLQSGPSVRTVETMRVGTAPFEKTIVANGSLAAFDRAVLSTKVAGRLASIEVDLGTIVKEGGLLARIAPEDYRLRVKQAQAQLAQARARLGLPLEDSNDQIEVEQTSTIRRARAMLEEARANQERIAKLAAQGIISESELETADATYAVALSRYEDGLEEVRDRQAVVAQRRSELEIAQQQLADTAIFAPFDGTIENRQANLGEYLSASTAILTIVRMDPLRLRLEISERDAPDIQTGQPVRLKVDGNPKNYLGAITRLSPVIEARTRILRVEADVSNPDFLRPGSFVRAEIVLDTDHRAITISTNALVTFAGIEKVFAIKDGKAVEKQVTTGRLKSGSEQIEILSGLVPGEIIVLNPGDLKTGDRVADTSERSS